MEQSKERDAFEAWAKTQRGWPLSAWGAWQARAALSPRQMVADSAGEAGPIGYASKEGA